MFHKKTLSAAIAVALSFGVSAVQAASFEKYPMQDGAQLATTTPLTSSHRIKQELRYAYEQFGDTQNKLEFPFRARYTLSKTVPNDIDLYVSFTLSGGATWGENLSSVSLDVKSADGLTSFKTAGTAPEVSIVNKGKTTDSVVSYLINTSKKTIGPDQVLDFSFKVANADDALKSIGGKITLTANVVKAQTAKDFVTGDPADLSLVTDLAVSEEGTQVTFEQGDDAGNPAYISVVDEGKTFEGPGVFNGSNVMVSYGIMGLKDIVGVLAWDTKCVPNTYLDGGALNCTALEWNSVDAAGNSKLTEGTILIEDGNFSSSGAASDGNVYINAKTKVLADEFTGATTAKWNLDKTDFANIVDYLDNKHELILTINGTTEVIENRQVKPKGTLVIKYNSGNSVTRSTFLRHLKKNGTVCTLYNIPPSNALDIVNIRITNDSPSVDGFVKGKLRDMDGKVIFQKTLVEQGGLKPHQTVRLQMEDLAASGESWAGRAVLTLESNIPHPLMQVYGLLRAREATGFPETPLMNMSTGATGNSCD